MADTEQGHCAKCGSDFLEYQAIEPIDDMVIYYPYSCNACGHDGKEFYNLHYTESE